MVSIAAATAFERVGTALCSVGESPLWSAVEQALYWVDIEGRRIHRWRAARGAEPAHEQSWLLEQRPACIALHAHSGLVCGLENSVAHLQLHADGSHALQELASVAHSEPGMRLNDGRCDRDGHFWAGSMVMNMALAAPAGRLYRIGNHADHGDRSAPAAPAAPVTGAEPLIVPNGLAFSPDGRTLYLSDSHPSVQKIWAFDHASDGSLSRRRLFVDMQQHPGRPDGAAVDVDGCYWSCANDAGRVHRFTPAGRLDRSLAVPVAKPSMCSFGGARLDELFVTSIRPASTAATGAGDAALAGATFVCRPGVQGLAETPVHSG